MLHTLDSASMKNCPFGIILLAGLAAVLALVAALAHWTHCSRRAAFVEKSPRVDRFDTFSARDLARSPDGAAGGGEDCREHVGTFIPLHIFHSQIGGVVDRRVKAPGRSPWVRGENMILPVKRVRCVFPGQISI